MDNYFYRMQVCLRYWIDMEPMTGHHVIMAQIYLPSNMYEGKYMVLIYIQTILEP